MTTVHNMITIKNGVAIVNFPNGKLITPYNEEKNIEEISQQLTQLIVEEEKKTNNLVKQFKYGNEFKLKVKKLFA